MLTLHSDSFNLLLLVYFDSPWEERHWHIQEDQEDQEERHWHIQEDQEDQEERHRQIWENQE